ncbi:polyadenylate-binding protein-interacting protein 4-like [Actinidia eriantha]|uniref:polyadenylate-binding protein-interacting protein 4-like n=1 Tax=Actinidia eriantha TaxID=165200 RepID=UPI00258B70DB|nr:polyadenylate-binding protein-interacting protein 4-like [Actinidia eriantha]
MHGVVEFVVPLQCVREGGDHGAVAGPAEVEVAGGGAEGEASGGVFARDRDRRARAVGGTSVCGGAVSKAALGRYLWERIPWTNLSVRLPCPSPQRPTPVPFPSSPYSLNPKLLPFPTLWEREVIGGWGSRGWWGKGTGVGHWGLGQGSRTDKLVQGILSRTFGEVYKRGWDQFEANETLFGVKSTFDEELYATKLEKGPKMRDLEREALRIAREIQVEETLDLHLAEERGFQLHENFDIDEETRFSSVFRGVDDTGYDENENVMLDSRNIETFSSTLGSAVSRPFAVLTSAKSNGGAQLPACSSTMDEVQPSLPSTARDLQRSNSSDHSASEFLAKSSVLDNESSILNLRIQENQFSGQHVENNYIKEFVEEQMLAEEEQTLKSEDLQSSLMAKKDGPSIRKLSPNATSYDPTSLGSSKCLEKMSFTK